MTQSKERRRARERSRERSTPRGFLFDERAATTTKAGFHVLSSVVVSESQKRACQPLSLSLSLFFPPRQEKLAYLRRDFFLAEERAPPKALKITHFEVKRRDEGFKVIIIRIIFTRDKNAALQRSVARWWTWKRACSPEHQSRSLKYRAIP